MHMELDLVFRFNVQSFTKPVNTNASLTASDLQLNLNTLAKGLLGLAR